MKSTLLQYPSYLSLFLNNITNVKLTHVATYKFLVIMKRLKLNLQRMNY